MPRLSRSGSGHALPSAFMAIALVYGGILLGTGLTSLWHDRPLVAGHGGPRG